MFGMILTSFKKNQTLPLLSFASGVSQEECEHGMESLAEQLFEPVNADTQRYEVGHCKMLTAVFSDGGKTGEVHLHFRS